MRWRIWEKKDSKAAVGIRQAYQLGGRPSEFLVAKEIRRVSHVVSSEFCWKYVSDRAVYKVLTSKRTIDQIHVSRKRKWESSRIEMVACAMSLILVEAFWNLLEPG